MTTLRNLFTRGRSDRGSLMTSIVFMIIGVGIMGIMLAVYLQRSTNDFITSEQANVRSAVSKLASNLLGQINDEFPEEWQYLDYNDLVEATRHLGENDAQNATAHLSYFAINPDTGVVVAEVEGESTNAVGIEMVADLKYTPSGAGVFKGVDDNGRPVWIYSNENLDTLALWEMAPNAIQYINDNGGYTAETPALAPKTSITADGDDAKATIGVVYCRYAGNAEYRSRHKIDDGPFTDWTAWSTTQTVTITVDEGQRVTFEAQAHCVTGSDISDPSPSSKPVSYTRPMTTPFNGPAVTVETTGHASWAATVCETGDPEYRSQYRINQTSWDPWTNWSNDRAIDVALSEGGLLEVQVQAHCATEYVTGPNSAISYGSAVRPLTFQPDAPAVSLSGGVIITVDATPCPDGTQPQTRWRTASNGSPLATKTYTGWTPALIGSIAAFEGSTLDAQAQQRCANKFATGPASDPSDAAHRVVPVTSVPNQPTVSLNAAGTAFQWPEATCPAGTTPTYQWSYSANGGTTVNQNSWTARPSGVPVTINEGGTLTVTLTGRCEGFAADGPASAPRAWNLDRPLTTRPAAFTISIDGNGAASWTAAAGCPTGTTTEYQWRRATARGGNVWGGWSAYSTSRSIGSQIGYDDRLQVEVNARCLNPDSGNFGPERNIVSAVVTRGIPTPATPGGFSGGGTNNFDIYWGAVGCAAGSVRYHVELTRGSGYLGGTPADVSTAHFRRTSIPAGAYIYMYTRAICIGTYTNSAWSGTATYRLP